MVSEVSPQTIAEGGTAQTSRLLLETLSIYDVMSCLAVGKKPTLLADGGSEWWYGRIILHGDCGCVL